MVLLSTHKSGYASLGERARKIWTTHKLEEALKDNVGEKVKTEMRKDMGGEMAHVAVNITLSI